MAEGDDQAVVDEGPVAVTDSPDEEFDANWKAPEEPDSGERLGEEQVVDMGDVHLHVPTPEEAAALNNSDPAAGAQTEELEPITCEAAFLVFKDQNGHWIGDSALVNRQVIVQRQAGMNDYRHACADLSSDLLAQESAQRSIMMQQQMMIQAARQAEAQRIGQAAGIPGGGVDLAELQRRAAAKGIKT